MYGIRSSKHLRFDSARKYAVRRALRDLWSLSLRDSHGDCRLPRLVMGTTGSEMCTHVPPAWLQALDGVKDVINRVLKVSA